MFSLAEGRREFHGLCSGSSVDRVSPNAFRAYLVVASLYFVEMLKSVQNTAFALSKNRIAMRFSV